MVSKWYIEFLPKKGKGEGENTKDRSVPDGSDNKKQQHSNVSIGQFLNSLQWDLGLFVAGAVHRRLVVPLH